MFSSPMIFFIVDIWALNLTRCGLVTHYCDIVFFFFFSLLSHFRLIHSFYLHLLYSSGSTLAQVMVLLQWCHNGRDDVTDYRRLNCYPTVCSGANQRKHQGPASLAFVGGIYRWLMYSPHKMTVTRKMFPFDDVIMLLQDVTKPLPKPMFIYHK